MPGVVGEVMVKANDEVFAGEPLIRLTDPELQSRITTAEAQIAMRRKVRNDENASARAATRRRAEDFGVRRGEGRHRGARGAR